MPRAITLNTIRAAGPAVYTVARRTPLVKLAPLTPSGRGDADPATRIHLKLETLQSIGSFKIRGAAGAPCTVMVIDTAPDTKLSAIERLGARIVTASYDECWKTVEQHQHDRLPGHFVHPFDDDRFISGNGTIGLEIIEQLPGVDAIVVSVGGAAAMPPNRRPRSPSPRRCCLPRIATAARALKPSIRIYAAEPETAEPLATSLINGRASYFPDWQASFVDGCGGKSVIPTMWPLLRDAVDSSIVVSLDEIKQAMWQVATGARVMTEGAGACAVAAALSGRAGSGTIVAVVSGGNIDAATLAHIITRDC